MRVDSPRPFALFQRRTHPPRKISKDRGYSVVQEYETIFRMWPFPQSTVAEIEPPPASQSNQDRVAEADKEFSAANGEYLEACLVVDRYCRTHRTPPQFFLLNDH